MGHDLARNFKGAKFTAQLYADISIGKPIKKNQYMYF